MCMIHFISPLLLYNSILVLVLYCSIIGVNPVAVQYGSCVFCRGKCYINNSSSRARPIAIILEFNINKLHPASWQNPSLVKHAGGPYFTSDLAFLLSQTVQTRVSSGHVLDAYPAGRNTNQRKHNTWRILFSMPWFYYYSNTVLYTLENVPEVRTYSSVGYKYSINI